MTDSSCVEMKLIDKWEVVIEHVLTKYMCEEIIHDRLFHIY